MQISMKTKKSTPILPLGRQLALLTRLYYGALTKQLEHLDIDRHYSILLVIAESEMPCCQQAIADLLHIDKVVMVRNINYLIKKNYIKRVVNPNDRREYWIQLTAKGKQHIPAIQQATKSLNEKAMKGNSTTAVKQFNAQLENMFKQLRATPANAVSINYKSKQHP